MRPAALLQEYLMDHDLRHASIKIYSAAIKSLEKHFGQTSDVEDIDRRKVLTWRNRVIEQGLSKRSWNTYSNHLRTIWGYAIEYGILPNTPMNPFKKTTLIPPKRSSKIISGEGIRQARNLLCRLVEQEEAAGTRSHITPAWFWLATFEMFYYTGIRLNALLCIRLRDVDWQNKLVHVNADTEKTHREFCVPITRGLEPHIEKLLKAATGLGFSANDQLFNVNRFSIHYRSTNMNIDQVEGMYKKLSNAFGIRITPHRFRHTLATDLMRHPERNIHLTKSLLNHSNIATTMSYIEVDYEHMRTVLDDRSLNQGALRLERREDPVRLPPVDAQNEPSFEQEDCDQNEPALLEYLPEHRSGTDQSIPKLQEPTAFELLTNLPKQKKPLKYPLEKISRPITGLSHELAWEGPGTLWADLGIPPCQFAEGSFEAGSTLDLRPERCILGSVRWN